MKQDKKTTIYDVADKAHVSLATVSRVLNSSGNVKPETIKKVKKVIADLNYQPDEIARGLVTRKTKTVGILMPSATDLFFNELTSGINDVSQIYNYNIFFTSTEGGFGLSISDVVEKLLIRKIDGLILLSDQFDHKVKKTIEDANIPYVLISGLINPKSKINQVSIDMPEAMIDAFEFFADSQQQKIAFLDYRLNLNDHQKLADVFAQQYQQHNLQPVEQMTKLLTEGTFEAGYQSFETLKDFDAVITSNDQLAAGLLAYAYDHQIDIPNDFQIIALQDTGLSTILRPQISAVSFSKYDIGALSMRMLTKLMNHEDLQEEQIVWPHTLVQRGTTK